MQTPQPTPGEVWLFGYGGVQVQIIQVDEETVTYTEQFAEGPGPLTTTTFGVFVQQFTPVPAGGPAVFPVGLSDSATVQES